MIFGDKKNNKKTHTGKNKKTRIIFGNPENGSSLILFVRRDTEIDKLCHNDCEQKALMSVIEIDENHCHKQIIRKIYRHIIFAINKSNTCKKLAIKPAPCVVVDKRNVEMRINNNAFCSSNVFCQ